MDGLLVSRMGDGHPEIFASIQGEGISAGLPSTFVRLAVCNLRCVWCDTAYTWDWSRYSREEQILPMPVEAVFEAVRALPPRRVVVTGGEPLLQRRQLAPLLRRLGEAGYQVEVETNGTVVPAEAADYIHQFNVSPKLTHSGNEGLARIRQDALRWFAADPRANFKFVVQSEAGLAEVEDLRAEFRIPADRVVLMPEGRSADELRARSPWLAEVCTRRGYRFSTRLHILLWGDKRGV